MEILRIITKDVFEYYVPVAKMPERNSSVFERVQQKISEAYNGLVGRVINADLVSSVEMEETNKMLIIHYVCIEAFLMAVRSLDLVLTATGFGIVSTESTAPASKHRVDTLVEQMGTEKIRVFEDIVNMMARFNGWADTEQARRCIPTLFYCPSYVPSSGLPLTEQNWQTACQRAVAADAILRGEISEEYMDELLTKLRTNALTNADIIVVDKCNRFFSDFIANYEKNALPNKFIIRSIVEQLESYPDSYQTYVSSRLYAKRHAEKFQNRKEDNSFFFM